jgi:two-component system response regulator GlrR
MSRSKGRILLVDDDPDVLKLLELRLRAAGFETISAGSGAEALARLEVDRPQAVVTDLRMEGMDGLELFEAIRQRRPALPVLMLTAHGTIPDAVAATRGGVFAFLTKPFEGREVIEQVERAVRVSGVAGSDANPCDEAQEWRQDMVTRSPAMEEVLCQARLVADSGASVLIRGASGTGKELLAQAIHRASERRERPFVAFNCAAIPEALMESELFGYAKGAFTGALRDTPGLFQAAHGGTLFLDEIGDMPASLQVKLLRVLQDRQVRPVGSTRSFPVDVRVISATHRDLEQEVRVGRFREDLYYRLNVVVLDIPPLAQRREDIPLLAAHFLTRLRGASRKQVDGFAPDATELLVGAPWPGNVRQLANVVEQAFALTTTPLIPASLVQRALRAQPSEFPSLEEARTDFEREYLIRLLKITRGNVAQAAKLADRNRTDFYKLLRRHQLDPALFKPAGGLEDT